MNKKIGIGLVLAVIAVFLIITIVKNTNSSGSGKRGNSQVRFFSRTGSQGFITPAELERLMNRNPSPQAQLEAFRVYSQYPDNSRPLDASMEDLIDPWKVVDEPLPLIDNPAFKNETALKKFMLDLKSSGKTDEEIEKQVKEYFESRPKYQFSANRHTLTLGDELIITLKITDSDGEPVPYSLADVYIQGDPQFSKVRLGTPEYNDAGIARDKKAGDGITTFTWKIPSADKKYWGNLSLQAVVSIKNQPEKLEIMHTFYGSPINPAVFTDSFAEKLDDGSLVISALVDVKKECKFVFQANLFNARNEPVHWATVNTILEPGMRTVSFLFFGKVFHDYAQEGHFTMRDIRGTCENLPFPARWLNDPSKMDQIVNATPLEEPVLYYLPYTAKSYKTMRAYQLKDFSKKEFQSSEKDAKLKELENQVPTN